MELAQADKEADKRAEQGLQHVCKIGCLMGRLCKPGAREALLAMQQKEAARRPPAEPPATWLRLAF